VYKEINECVSQIKYTRQIAEREIHSERERGREGERERGREGEREREREREGESFGIRETFAIRFFSVSRQPQKPSRPDASGIDRCKSKNILRPALT
jgi:hypothetical protein